MCNGWSLKGWVSLCLLASLSVITNAATTVYTSRSLWEQAVGVFDEEFFTDAVLNPNLDVISDAGYVDVTGQEGYGTGVWWDRVVPGPNGDRTTWLFADAVFGFGADWNLAVPGGVGTGIQLYLNGIPVSEEIPNTLANGFWGIVSTIPFDEILITAGTTSANAETYVMDNMVYSTGWMEFWKEDGDPNCVSENDTIVYQICFSNADGDVLQEAFVVDWLNDWVDYPQGVSQLIFDPNEDPPFTMWPPDENYTPRPDHCYMWYLGDIDPNTSGCLELRVVVNDRAVPGEYIHNVAELYGLVMVPGPDPNILIPETRLVARAWVDTLVCCEGDPITTLYVDQNATGTNSGLNWPNAFTNLQSALERAKNTTCGQIDTILVAEGTYVPGQTEDDTFALSENLSLFGGYSNGGTDRDPSRYKTILTGVLDPNGLTRVETIVTMADETLLDGFTISNAAEYCIYGSGVDFSLIQCTIEGSDQYGIRAIVGNVNLSWCTVQNNSYHGIWHSGSGFTLNIENSWCKKQGQFGIFSDMSTPVLRNSIITESDLSQTGNAGVRMVSPSSQPILQNCTISHNRSVGISQVGGAMPSLVNSIVYHNNSGGRQLSANLDPDVVAQYSCIADCNEVNNNINVDPKFLYFNPNNVRIMAGGPCHDSGLTVLDHYTQFDMDKRDRVLGSAVDRGAYEIECEDAANPFDRNADGRVNFQEFSDFSRFWMAHDPNDPALNDPNHVDYDYLTDPNSPGYVTASSIAAWYPDGYTFNYVTTGGSQYAIDLADLIYWTQEAPWLWRACWLTEAELLEMTSGGGEMLLMVIPAEAGIQTYSAMKADTTEVQQKSVQEQMFDLATAIVFLEKIWLEEPDLQQEIDAEAWQKFMDSVYQNLLDFQTRTVQIE